MPTDRPHSRALLGVEFYDLFKDEYERIRPVHNVWQQSLLVVAGTDGEVEIVDQTERQRFVGFFKAV
jgi:hypothetical protein